MMRWFAPACVVALAGCTAAGWAQDLGANAGDEEQALSLEAPSEVSAEALELPLERGAPPPGIATMVGRDERLSGLLEANAAYENGDYETARSLYLEIARSGVTNGDLQYNLGNASLRSGKLGLAVASYLRAAALRPRDEDVQANLTFARSQARDALVPPSASPVLRTLAFWHFSLSLRELLLVALTLNFLFWLSMALRARYPTSEALRWLTGLAALTLLLVGGSAVWRLLQPEEIAVVTAAEVDALSGFEEGAIVRFQLHAGSELRVAERRDDHLRVALPTGEQGWIERSVAEVVER